jgi:hypothetical protein
MDSLCLEKSLANLAGIKQGYRLSVRLADSKQEFPGQRLISGWHRTNLVGLDVHYV